MLRRIGAALGDDSTNVRGRVFAVYGLLILTNLLAWAWALVLFRNFPVLLGTALLAYSFGLRHAVDADHVAAIDSVTRKLMQERRRPVPVGLYFSLGHSTVVLLASAAIALTAAAYRDRLTAFQSAGGVIGTLVSALFLLAIAIANIFVLSRVYRAFRNVKRGGRFTEDDFDTRLSGFLGGLFRPPFRLIARSWQMYPLGFASTRPRRSDSWASRRSKPQGSVDLVDPGVPDVVHCGNGTGGHHGRCSRARRLWLGVYRPGP